MVKGLEGVSPAHIGTYALPGQPRWERILPDMRYLIRRL